MSKGCYFNYPIDNEDPLSPSRHSSSTSNFILSFFFSSLISQAPQIGGFGNADTTNVAPTVEELMEQKERLEDLIAEQQIMQA